MIMDVIIYLFMWFVTSVFIGVVSCSHESECYDADGESDCPFIQILFVGMIWPIAIFVLVIGVGIVFLKNLLKQKGFL